MTMDPEVLSRLPTELRNLVLSKRNVKDIVEDRELAKVGDSLLNLLNVLAKVSGYIPEESKVSNRMLRQVSQKAGLRMLLKKRLKRTEIGNAVEALVAYWYLRGRFSMQDFLEEIKKTTGFDSALIELIRRLFEEEGW